MWDNAPLLRTISNLLFGLSAVLVLYGSARFVLHMPMFSLHSVQLSEAPRQVPVELIRRVVQEQISGNFFTVDLNKTRSAMEQLPWVRQVSIRRIFPWCLKVQIEEHKALARWNGMSLVNTYGEIFSGQTDQQLPAFFGQPNTSAEMSAMYDKLSQDLRPIKLEVTQISLSPRYAWQLRLNNGLVLELGREQMQQRLERFVSVYPYSLSSEKQVVTHVDLRYRNGFAAYLPNGLEAQGRQSSGNRV